MSNTANQGLRFNHGKPRMALIPPFAEKQIARVLTKGAAKYTVKKEDGTVVKGDHNWKKGLPWTEVGDSMKRHFNAWLSGEDFDPETGELHMAHVAVNAIFLTEYQHIRPEFDDRYRVEIPPVALDIDEVLADFTDAWAERFGLAERPHCWKFDRHDAPKWEEVVKDRDFWMNIRPLINPKDLPFEPVAYITNRSIPEEWTTAWLDLHGFPGAPVASTGYNNMSKPELCGHYGAKWFVDDNYQNFIQFQGSGVHCWLMDAAHNRKFNVGARRIYNLKELLEGPKFRRPDNPVEFDFGETIRKMFHQ